MPAVPTSPRVKLRSTSRRVPRVREEGVADHPEIDSEPTMRLSRAILVMFLLHVVAVGGFCASSLIKEHNLRRSGGGSTTPLEAEDSHIATKAVLAESDGHASDASSSPATQNVHIVRPGDTPVRIANENGVTLAALIAANGTDIVTNGLRTGQELKLPEKPAQPAVQPPTTTNSAVDAISGRQKAEPTPAPANVGSSAKLGKPLETAKSYVVGKGENVNSIAQKLHVNPDALTKLNQIDDPKKLKPGQKLRIPPAAKGK